MSPIFAHAADDLTDWEILKRSGTPEINVSGTVVTFSANGLNGTEFANVRKTIPETIGVLAEIEVSAINGNNAWCGISKVLGTIPSGNYIQALVELVDDLGGKVVRFRVRELDTNFAEVKIIAYGYLGDSKNGWKTGQTVLVGLARLGDDVYFYTPANGAFIKIQLLQKMDPLDSLTIIYVWAEDGPNSIDATVGNLVTF
jgi:hypothetical protein